MNYTAKVVVYGNKPANKTVVPARTLLRDAEWATRLADRFNQRQLKRASAQRAIAVVLPL